MAWEYELETDIRYLQGIEKGEEKGMIQKAIEKDIEFVTTILLTTDFDVHRIAEMTKHQLSLWKILKKV